MVSRRVNKQYGFGMIELIVVVVVIAILAAIAMPKIMAYLNRLHEAAIQKLALNMNTSMDMFRNKYMQEGHGAPNFQGFNIQPTTGLPIAYNTADCVQIAAGIAQAGSVADFYHKEGDGKAAFETQLEQVKEGKASAPKGRYAAVFDAGICYYYSIQHPKVTKFLSYNNTVVPPVNEMTLTAAVVKSEKVQPTTPAALTEPATPAAAVPVVAAPAVEPAQTPPNKG